MFTGQDLDHRGFPCAVRTDDADHFCTVHGAFSGFELEAAQLLLEVAPRHHRGTGLDLAVAVAEEGDGLVTDADVLLR